MYCCHPFVMTCRLRARKGCEESLKSLLEDIVKKISDHEGLMLYCFHQAKQDPSVFFLYAQFTSEASFRMHLDSEAIRSLQDKMIDLLDEKPVSDCWKLFGKAIKKE